MSQKSRSWTPEAQGGPQTQLSMVPGFQFPESWFLMQGSFQHPQAQWVPAGGSHPGPQLAALLALPSWGDRRPRRLRAACKAQYWNPEGENPELASWSACGDRHPVVSRVLPHADPSRAGAGVGPCVGILQGTGEPADHCGGKGQLLGQLCPSWLCGLWSGLARDCFGGRSLNSARLCPLAAGESTNCPG